MMKEYIPVRLDEIEWKEATRSKLYLTIDCTPIISSNLTFLLEVTVNLKTQVISYIFKQSVFNKYYNISNHETLFENQYDYITEKGALKWLYREISKIAFYKKFEYCVPYSLTKILENWDDELKSYVDYIYETTSSEVLKSEALKLSQAYLDYDENIYRRLKLKNGKIGTPELVFVMQTQAPHIARAILDFNSRRACDYNKIALSILNGEYDNELLQLHTNSL